MFSGLQKKDSVEFLAIDENATFNFAKEFAKELHEGNFVAFFGGLGVGKTLFIKGLCAGLGFLGNVSSPTFALIHEYRLEAGKFKTGEYEQKKTEGLLVVHCDMWRIESEDDLDSIGFFEYLTREDVIMVVEWSEKIVDFLPNDCYRVSLKQVEETKRLIEIKKWK